HYAQIVEVCMKGINAPWDLALAPDRFDDWTSAMRTDQIARLESARDHDRAAVGAITSTLESLT
ncbi:MAG TPA: hypothetical protein VMY39_05775, partial [Planctomycetota bacterium]|nr:hypothetical protein [Planctomycetota bacterium]